MTNDDFRAELRFYKNNIYLLGEVLDIPGITKCPNGVLVDGMALSVLLKRFFPYPCLFADIVALWICFRMHKVSLVALIAH